MEKKVLYLIILILGLSPFGLQAVNPNGIKTIVIDPGHGGKDPGAVVGQAREKTIVLDIALQLGRMIKTNMSDIKVLYTRDKDVFVPLLERAQFANRNGADLFISIHANYCPTPSISGTETYVLGLHRTKDNLEVAKKENSVILLEDDYTTKYEGFDPNLPESYIMFELIQDNYLDQSLTFAELIQDQFRTSAKRGDRDVRQAGFLVLRESAMPSVLIEAGYLSNTKENQYLMTEKGRSEIAKAIYQSLEQYKNRIENRALVNQPQKEIAEPGNTSKQPNNNQAKTQSTPGRAIQKATVQTENKSANQPASTASDASPVQAKVQFAVQIASSTSPIQLNAPQFKKISGVTEIKVKSTYKYVCYLSDNYNLSKSKLNEIRQKIPGAFIVAVTNGTTMPASEYFKNRK